MGIKNTDNATLAPRDHELLAINILNLSILFIYASFYFFEY